MKELSVMAYGANTLAFNSRRAQEYRRAHKGLLVPPSAATTALHAAASQHSPQCVSLSSGEIKEDEDSGVYWAEECARHDYEQTKAELQRLKITIRQLKPVIQSWQVITDKQTRLLSTIWEAIKDV